MAKKSIKTDIKEEKNKVQESNIIRPQTLKEYIGQNNIKKNLEISIKAAKCRDTALDHFLLSGPPGLGKTSLAGVIANEMNAKLHTVSAPVIEKTGDMAAVLASLEQGDILFIDEIHRLPKTVEELLYSAMEDYKIDILIGSMEQTKSITMELPKFTLVGATTREGMLTKPLLDRFANHYRVSYYEPEDLSKIVMATSKKYNTPFAKDMAYVISKACRGTPRIANNITKRISDYILAENIDLTENTIYHIFDIIGIDKNGLTEMDRKYLSILSDVFPDKPVGLNTLAAYLGESEDTIKETIEPHLIRCGLILRTSTGRVLNKD